jgi:hypothetical protein
MVRGTVYTPASLYALARGVPPKCWVGGPLDRELRRLVRLHADTSPARLRSQIRSFLHGGWGRAMLKYPFHQIHPTYGRDTGPSWREFKQEPQYAARMLDGADNRAQAAFDHCKEHFCVKLCVNYPGGPVHLLALFSGDVARKEGLRIATEDGALFFVASDDSRWVENPHRRENPLSGYYTAYVRKPDPGELAMRAAEAVERIAHQAEMANLRRERRVRDAAILAAVKKLGLDKQLIGA